jgi:hypothetical protein
MLVSKENYVIFQANCVSFQANYVIFQENHVIFQANYVSFQENYVRFHANCVLLPFSFPSCDQSVYRLDVTLPSFVVDFSVSAVVLLSIVLHTFVLAISFVFKLVSAA